ncbi:hypothetical protein CKAH01_01427 [Colletotrichum kahawae]|uniref:Uncharacterized protein n=1 Tax=Colletotrichum kahawae TaxID=34407 RepID=A0AAD9Y5R3_COLKA|nr:hypothetical protein CKAH01_01427 [Colletotrichum kahawae]
MDLTDGNGVFKTYTRIHNRLGRSNVEAPYQGSNHFRPLESPPPPIASARFHGMVVDGRRVWMTARGAEKPPDADRQNAPDRLLPVPDHRRSTNVPFLASRLASFAERTEHRRYR